MPTKASSAGAQQTLSSFFKPATPSQKRPLPNEVLILDSDDDDDQGTAPVSAGARTLAGKSKKVKLEHDTRTTQLSPIASTSRLPRVAAATSSSAKAPSASAKRIRDFAYLEGREGAPRTTPSDADKARHDAFVKRLSLGPNLLQKRSSYLQKEHHLAAAEQDTDGVRDCRHGAAAGMSPTNTEDLEEEEDEEEDSPSIGTSRSKGKGKAKEVAPSRLAKFAAKGKSTATSPGGDAIKYTPLEQQVLALRKANPGVLLIVEVRPEPGSFDSINADNATAANLQVGYKFRFFDEDARVASRILNIACFPQQHMLTASIPTHRLDVHVKRLLNAGYKVGIVRQQETAAWVPSSGPSLVRANAMLDPGSRKRLRIARLPLHALSRLCTPRRHTSTSSTANLWRSRARPPPWCASSRTGWDRAPTPRSRLASSLSLPAPVRWCTMVRPLRYNRSPLIPRADREFDVTEFEDGFMRAELETRLLHLQPSELLVQHDLSSKTTAIVKYLAGHAAYVTFTALAFLRGKLGSTYYVPPAPVCPTLRHASRRSRSAHRCRRRPPLLATITPRSAAQRRPSMLLRIKQVRSFSLLLTTRKKKRQVPIAVPVRCLSARSDCDPALNEASSSP